MSLPWILATHQFFMTGVLAMVILSVFPTAQTIPLADQAGDKKQLFRGLYLFALSPRSEKLV